MPELPTCWLCTEQFRDLLEATKHGSSRFGFRDRRQLQNPFLVAAVIGKVYFIEPYPKSLVNELYPDSIRIEGEEAGEFVNFVPFAGVAPRCYQDVFKLGDYDQKGLVEHAYDWKTEIAKPSLGEYPFRAED